MMFPIEGGPIILIMIYERLRARVQPVVLNIVQALLCDARKFARLIFKIVLPCIGPLIYFLFTE